MSDIRELVKEHLAYYELWPYFVIIEERHGSSTPITHRIQAGFDIDIYAARTDSVLPLHSPKYAIGTTELERIAKEVSDRAAESRSIEVISFPSTVVLDTQNNFQSQAMLKIRINHFRGLDQPAGPAEERALQELEGELQARGIRLGKTRHA
jgi:hypothetical protein